MSHSFDNALFSSDPLSLLRSGDDKIKSLSAAQNLMNARLTEQVLREKLGLPVDLRQFVKKPGIGGHMVNDVSIIANTADKALVSGGKAFGKGVQVANVALTNAGKIMASKLQKAWGPSAGKSGPSHGHGGMGK